MKNKKRGVGLIVLVGSAVVIIILIIAGILTLKNAGALDIIANDLGNYNINQVSRFANVAWGEAYFDGGRETKDIAKHIKKFLITNNINLQNYKVTVTTTGAVVEAREKVKSPYKPNNWEEAYSYSKGVLSHYNKKQTLNGDITIKLYKNGNKTEYEYMGKTVELDNFDVVIEGKGNMPNINLVDIGNGIEKISELFNTEYITMDNKKSQYIENVYICRGITSVGDNAFYGWSNISQVYMDYTVSSIGNYAFGDCINLDNLYFSDNLTIVGEGALFGVKNIILDDLNDAFIIDNGILYDYDKTEAIYMFGNNKDVILPSTVITIRQRAFYNKEIMSIALPEGLLEIKKDAFSETYFDEFYIPSTCNIVETLPNAEKIKIYSTEFEIKNAIEQIDKPSSNTTIYVLSRVQKQNIEEAIRVKGWAYENFAKVIYVESKEEMNII